METQKVKAVLEVSAESGNCSQKEKGKRKQWSIQFLELLLKELEDEEREEKKVSGNAKRGASREEDGGEEVDPRIVLRGEEPVPADWDSLEISREEPDPVLACELYEDIIGTVKCVGNWKANILYKIADAVMQDYYDAAFDEQAVGELFYGCYQKCIEKNKKIAASEEKKYEILETLYEYFSRVNARKSVAKNEREGRTLVERCGLTWAGTTYYNSQYYYICERIQKLLQEICNEISAEQEISGLSFADLEKKTQFLHVGGTSFHGVFVWVQKKDNDPGNQYGMKDLKKEPPERFVYLYRNHFTAAEEAGIRLLGKMMRGDKGKEREQLWRSFTIVDGREYHNGMSYLLEGSLMDEQDETLYGTSMGFLQNFRLYRVSGCVEYLSVMNGYGDAR